MVDNHIEASIKIKIVKRKKVLHKSSAHFTFVCSGCSNGFQLSFIGAEFLKNQFYLNTRELTIKCGCHGDALITSSCAAESNCHAH